MPNYCNYDMKITGSKEGCYALLNCMRSYDDPNHFWRIFSSDVYDESGDEEEHVLYVCGDCAWSLETCCRASGYSGGVDLFDVNCARFNVCLEAYSREPGMQFEEHYIYDNDGECMLDECRDIEVFWWDKGEFPEYTDYLKDCPDAPPESAFDDTNEVYRGGFGNEYGVWHI